MPQATAISIADGATTPVTHIFSPIGKDDKGVLWFEQTSPTPTNTLGAKRIGYKQTRSTMTGASTQLTGSSKVVITLHVPTLETLGTNGAGYAAVPRVAYKEAARCEFDLAERSTKQERVDTRVLFRNLISHVLVQGAIDDLQPIYI